MVTRWLGEYHARGWSDDALREWGRRIKTSEAERLLFEDTLRGQRLALFPEYDNPDLTYDDIASPWRQTATSAWGQSIDESDPFFLKLVRTNDAVQADQMLRAEGMRRGIGAVVNRAVSDAASEFGGGQVLNSGV